MRLRETRDFGRPAGSLPPAVSDRLRDRFGGNPFDPAAPDAYARWRDGRLAGQPATAADLVVEMRHLGAPTAAERAALTARLAACNMAIYAAPPSAAATRDSLVALGAAFGLRSLDTNMLSDDDGITPLAVAVAAGGTRGAYIPYTNRPLAWHTDGYYNAPDRQVRGLLLHCARPAASGGGNALMDHEVAYILLRERDPALVAALMRPDALTIPGNTAETADAKMGPRPDRPGPVFRVMPDGRLHMRYTRRQRHVIWADDPVVEAARQALDAILADDDAPYVLHHRLEAGQGLISANVLHNRTRFEEAEAGGGGRLMYRARYHDALSW